MRTERSTFPLSKKRGGHIFFGVAPVVFLLLACGEQKTPYHDYKADYFAMNSRIRVSLRSADETLGEPEFEVGKIFSLYDSLADNTQSVTNHKNVYDINQTNQAVTIEKELYDLLSFSLQMEKESYGYVNPLIGNLSDLWKDHLHPERVTPSGSKTPDPSIPSQEEIRACLSEMENSDLVLKEEEGKYTVRRIGTAKIDLGAIAKGYAAQKAWEWIKDNGFTAYYVDAGTSSILLGEQDLDGGAWTVNIRGISQKMKLKNVCVGTSGIDAQEADIGGVSYSHIINPFTGSAHVDYFGVTLLGQDAGVLDVLSTAFILMGVNENLDKVNALASKYNVSYVFYNDGEIVKNQGVVFQ